MSCSKATAAMTDYGRDNKGGVQAVSRQSIRQVMEACEMTMFVWRCCCLA